MLESILEGWSFDGGTNPAATRSLSWSSEYRVQGIGSNQAVTYIAGRAANGINAEQVDSATLARVGTMTNLTTFLASTDAGVSRVNVLSNAVAPAFIWVSEDGLATLYRMQTQNISFGAMSSPGLIVQGDDVIEVPAAFGSNRWLATSRCAGNCTFLGVTSSATGSYGRLLTGLSVSNTNGLSAPTEFSTIEGTGGVSLFEPTSPIRVATDGNMSLYLAGQGPGGTLVVERRSLGTGAREVLYTATGPLKLADMTRAQMGSGVYLLVTLSQPASFAGTIFNPTAANLGNVAVIRIDTATGASANFFDIPLDQQAVAFAKSQGFLYVAVQEGPNAVLWKIPAP